MQADGVVAANLFLAYTVRAGGKAQRRFDTHGNMFVGRDLDAVHENMHVVLTGETL